jgi:hypothetical protein
MDEEFNRFDDDDGDRAANHADARDDGHRNIAVNANNDNDNHIENHNHNNIHDDNDNNMHNDNNYDNDLESNNSDEEESNLVGIESVNASFQVNMWTGDFDDEDEEAGEVPVYIPSDPETVETERPHEDPSSPGSLSNHIGSDDTTLVGSSQPFSLIPSKSGIHHSRNMPSDNEKQDYGTHFASSPCPKRAGAPTMDTETPIVIFID